jgi:hypothetical protein
MDSRGEIREANDAVHRLLKYRAGTLIGLSLPWIMPPSRHALLPELIEALTNGARRSLPLVLMRDDSSHVLVMVTAEPYSGPRGRELALTLELDDEPTSAIQRVDLEALRDAARPATPPAPLQVNHRPVRARPSASLPNRVASTLHVPEQLTACRELLQRIACQLEHPATMQNPQQQALARLTIREASLLIDHCQNALSAERRSSHD